jgi:PAS domain S-box-containing protein
MSPLSGLARRLAAYLLSFRYVVIATTVLFTVVLGVAVLLVYQNAEAMRRQISEDFNHQQLILAQQAASRIDDTVRDLIAEVTQLRRQLAEAAPASRYQVMESALDRMRAKGMAEILLLDSAGHLLDRCQVEGPPALPLRVLLDRCPGPAPARLAFSPLFVDRGAEGGAAVTALLNTDVPARTGDPGRLVVRVEVSRLVARATQDLRSGKTGYAWVIDETGRFLYHPERDFVGKNAFEARRQRKPYISFSQINRIMKEHMLRGRQGRGSYVSGWHRGVEGEITKLIAFSPVKRRWLAGHRLWSVAVAAPTGEVASAVRSMYLRHVAVVIALVAGMFVCGLTGAVCQWHLSTMLQKRIGQQERYMTSILQNSVDAILFVDNDNRVQVWNHGAELLFGYTADEMLGRTFHRLVPRDMDAEDELRHIQEETLTKGYLRHYVTQRVRKDGERLTVDISRTLVRDEASEIIGSTVIVRDVTELELQQRIYHTEKLASIGNLAAGVAHEINNPLALILGFADLLLERFDPGMPEYNDLKIIEENANRAKKTVEALLGFARVTEGLEDTIDVSLSLHTVTELVRNTLMTAKVELVLRVPESLPRVRGDAREFQQVIFNLVANAVAAMQPTGGKLTLAAEQEDGWVHVTVADTGPGIPDRIKRRIFDPFFTTKKVGEGTGLGLSLCYGIVSKSGGRIDFASVAAEDNPEAPTGTTFVVSMPVNDPAAQGRR